MNYCGLLISAFLAIIPSTGQVDMPGRSTAKGWPAEGPPLLFEIKGIGNGYSSPAFSGDYIYITGERDGEGYLGCYDRMGVLQWEEHYGEEWVASYSGTRAAPTITGGLLYLCSGMGEIKCFQAADGKMLWSLNLISDLGGTIPTYGYSMPMLIEGDHLYCSPGGAENNVVALNRFTGEINWSSTAIGESPGYGSPIIIELPARKLLVTSSEFAIMGLDAAGGELLWSYELAFKGELPCNEPLFDGMYLYWVAGPGNGAVKARLSEDGSSIEPVWKNEVFDSFFGGFVKNGDFLYGASDRFRKWMSVDAETGEQKEVLSFSIGSTIPFGDMLVLYNQRGEVALANPVQGKLELAGSFRVLTGTREHFSHPVIEGNRLFIRHGESLLAYDVS